MRIWISIGLLSAVVALAIWHFMPHQGIIAAVFLVAVAVVFLSLIGLIYTLVLRAIYSLPVIPEQRVAVLTRDGRYIGFQGRGRMYRWLFKPLLYPLHEIKTVIPRVPVLFETPPESICIHEGIEVQAQLYMSYCVGPTADDIYNAAFKAPDPPGWKDAVEKLVAPAVLRATIANETLSNLIENQAQISERLRQEIGDLIRPWGFEVQWVQLTNFHVPRAVNEGLLRGMQLQSISQRLSEAAKDRLQVIEAALEQKLDPSDVMTPHDILILRYIEALEKLGESPATKVVLPYDILETIGGLRGALSSKLQSGQVPPSAPSAPPGPGPAGPTPQASAPKQTAAPAQPTSPSEVPGTSP
jgi:regulator of protease activity HflC (stomatin/prohibitin superfamily)